MNARLDAAIDLQDEAIAEHDGAITLLGLQGGCSEIGMPLAPSLAKSPIVGADQLAGSPAKTAPSGDSAKESVAESGVIHGTIKNSPAAILRLQLRHCHIRQLFLDLLGFLAQRHGTWHDIDLRITFDILDLPQQDLRGGIRNGDGIEDLDGADGPILALKPAAGFQERGQAAQEH